MSTIELLHDIPILGPIGIAISTLGIASQQILPFDPVRRGFIIHNPGGNNVRLAPGNLAASVGAGSILIEPESEFSIFADDIDRLINLNCSWNACADSGSTNPLTIFNFTDDNQSVAAPEALANVTSHPTIASPIGSAASLGTASVKVLEASPVRRGVIFHNPGTIPLAICPENLTAVFGAGSMVVLPGQERRIIAEGRVRVNCGWNGMAQSGTNNPLSILSIL
jgi:hypothetical protein